MGNFLPIFTSDIRLQWFIDCEHLDGVFIIIITEGNASQASSLWLFWSRLASKILL